MRIAALSRTYRGGLTLKRIKDFFYNWNDLVIVLLILAAAAAVIYWRSTMIMDYPKTLAKEIQEGTAELDIEMPAEGEEAAEAEEAEADSDADTEDADADSDKDDGASTESAENTDENEDDSKEGKDDKKDENKSDADDSTDGIPAPKDDHIWKNGKLINDVTVTTSEGSAMEASQALIDAGLFSSYENFEEICKAYGFEATDIKASEFTFKKGFTQQQIAEEVTKPME